MAHFLLFSFSFPFYFFVYTDVFDMLLLRPFVHPFDVFSCLKYFFAVPGVYAAARQFTVANMV